MITGGGALSVRNTAREGLLVKTASTVTGASTVVLGATAAEGIRGVDLSAGTTSNSSIRAAADTTSIGLTLIGGKGKNTITGSKGSDVLVGNAQDDVLTGGDLNDRITTGDGRDTVKGGLGADTIVMGTKLDGFDSISGGTGRRFEFTGANTDAGSLLKDHRMRPSFLVTRYQDRLKMPLLLRIQPSLLVSTPTCRHQDAGVGAAWIRRQTEYHWWRWRRPSVVVPVTTPSLVALVLTVSMPEVAPT